VLRKWLSTHRSVAVATLSGALIAALIITVAVVSTGYSAQKLSLDDGSVWVANGTSQVIGRANPQVLALNSVVTSAGSQIDVVQQGTTVLLFDRSNAKVDIVDPATSTVLDSVPLPPQDPELFIAGGNVVVGSGSTGQYWIVSLADLPHFDAQSQPTLSLGANTVASVTADGTLFVLSASAREVYRIDAAQADTVSQTWSALVDATHTGLSITSVGGQWAVLDSANRRLYTAGAITDLSPRVRAGASVALQQPSDSGSGVLVSYSGGLLNVPFTGGSASVIASGQTGTAVAPAIVDGCTYAAWSSGTAWRHCDGSAPSTLALDSVPSAAGRLSFVANGDSVVLNDPSGGGTWAVQQDGQLIDNWSELITVRNDQQQVQDNTEDTPPNYEKAQTPPVAVNDAFGARPGRSSVLPVLLNDYDPNGDPLVITSFTAVEEAAGHIDAINNAQQLQVTLAPGASGTLSFSYTITDGRGGTASATVVVTVRQPSENSPPVQVRQTKTLVAQGGRVTTTVLGDWVDPDGDAFYLQTASTSSPDTVTYKPEGNVVFTEGGAASTLRAVTLVVSDGRAAGTGSLAVTVKPAGQVPIIAEPFVALAYSGQVLTLSPLDHVRGGTGTLRLASVPAKTGATITASLEAGTFTFSSTQVGTHYLDYVVNDGDQTATGQVRVDVAAPPDANTKPITIPKTMFVHTLTSETVDVASTDIDPAGGVLLVTGVFNVAENSGVRAEVIQDRAIRVTLTAPLDSGPVTFNYRITNGLADAVGSVTVVQIPATSLQPPIANDDSVTVRVGDAITIPVLDNDVQPDGEDLTLNPLLSTSLKGDSGLLFASGNVLRYLAPQKTGDFTAVYEVSGPDGQVAQAQVKIAVREPNEATNNPPVPVTVVARVLAGATVRIKIPLTGIDPDGDSVQLLGQETSPLKGSVTTVGPDFFDYVAGDYSAGTDTFSYSVVDALGARATGTVRVGIAPKVDGGRNPVAIEDDVTTRPGAKVSVQVLANDSDPDGGKLTVTKVKPNTKDVSATIKGDIVTVQAPKTAGTYALVYTIRNGFGGESSNFLRVVVTPDAPLAYPQVDDTVLTLTDILGQDAIDVNVLRNVFFADGPVSGLKVSLLPGYAQSASVTSTKKVHVRVLAKSQIIPFAVSNPEDPRIVSYGFVWVPGTDDALPQLNRKAPPLKVASESNLRIDLDQYVLAIAGRKVHLTDSAKVQATHANGDNLVVNDHMLSFTSADKYFGPASISFEVTDGASAKDPNGHVATLVLPIAVTYRENQPPSFIGGVIDFEPGASRTIDLSKLTNYPYPKDANELAYTVLSPLPVGFSYTVTGQTLVLRANSSAQKGSTTAIQLSVRDALAVGKSGRIQLNVVSSSKPLAVPQPDVVAAARGTSTTVDVLTNDQATNPFPDTPLRVIDIRGIDGASLPTGVSITPSSDNSRLSVTVSSSAVPGTVNVQYEVADATNDPDRYVWGNVSISVQDKPDPVTAVTATAFGDRDITLRWTPGSDNNSPITGYEVTMLTTGGDTISTTSCAVTVCDITTPGNGPGNAVRLRVVAKNALGSSAASSLGTAIWSDLIPPAPTTLTASPLDGGLHITWNRVSTPSGGSPVDNYSVVAGGVATNVDTSACGANNCRVDVGGLSNGQAVSVSVTPTNGAFASLATWNTASTTGVPASVPKQVAPPAASVVDNAIAVDWASAFDANGRDITGYAAVAYTGAAPNCGNQTPAGSIRHPVGLATSTTFSGLSNEQSYSIIVFATNAIGCGASSPVIAHTAPGVVTAISTSGPSRNGNVWDVALQSASIGGSALTSDYTFYYRLSTGSGAEHGPVSLGDFLAAEASQFGTVATVQLRACRSFDGGAPICDSTYSDGFALAGVPVNPQVSQVSFAPTGDGVLDHGGVFTWLSWPAGTYEGIQYSCGSDPGFTAADTSVAGGSCTAASLLNDPTLTIRVIANGGTTYDLVYDINGNVH
jgi:hypothetical protein